MTQKKQKKIEIMSRMELFDSVLQNLILRSKIITQIKEKNVRNIIEITKWTDITIDILIDKMFNESIVNTMNANMV